MSAYTVDSVLFIRTVTYHYIGRVVAVYDHELVLESAVWVADSGRFGAALETGRLAEWEVYPEGPVVINRGAIVDAARWSHKIPRTGQ